MSLESLFPSRFGAFIFVSYMALFVSQGLLVTASRRGRDEYPYDPTSIVLVTEVVKLVVSVGVFLKEKPSLRQLVIECVGGVGALAYYAVPAVLYCAYNNLSFVNLVTLDPTSYFMFMQIRLLMTGLVYQVLFRRRLSRLQWLSLVLVTIGCMIQKMENGFVLSKMSISGVGLALVLVQVSCSVFAGVYNEYLLKRVPVTADVHVMIQNVFMYVDSIACNVLVLAAAKRSDLNLTFLKDPFPVAIIVNNALVGVVTSLFLKNLDSILKSFASALELVFTAVLSFLLLGIPITANTVVAVIVVGYAVVLYAKNPLQSECNTNNKVTDTKGEIESEALLKSSSPA